MGSGKQLFSYVWKAGLRDYRNPGKWSYNAQFRPHCDLESLAKELELDSPSNKEPLEMFELNGYIILLGLSQEEKCQERRNEEKQEAKACQEAAFNRLVMGK